MSYTATFTATTKRSYIVTKSIMCVCGLLGCSTQAQRITDEDVIRVTNPLSMRSFVSGHTFKFDSQAEDGTPTTGRLVFNLDGTLWISDYYPEEGSYYFTGARVCIKTDPPRGCYSLLITMRDNQYRLGRKSDDGSWLLLDRTFENY